MAQAERHGDIAARAEVVDAWLDGAGAGTVGSYGVGGAALEWWLHRLRPERRLLLTDYGDATVRRLSELFPEAQVLQHDLRRDGPVVADVHLFHRIDTEFSKQEWHDVMQRFSSVRILVVAAGLANTRALLIDLGVRAARRQASSAGFLRTRAALEELWSSTHTARRFRVHDLDAWALTPIAGSADGGAA